jgi:hypothetical protein
MSPIIAHANNPTVAGSGIAAGAHVAPLAAAAVSAYGTEIVVPYVCVTGSKG